MPDFVCFSTYSVYSVYSNSRYLLNILVIVLDEFYIDFDEYLFIVLDSVASFCNYFELKKKSFGSFDDDIFILCLFKMLEENISVFPLLKSVDFDRSLLGCLTISY